VIVDWCREVEAERAEAERQLGRDAAPRPYSEEELVTLLTNLQVNLKRLANADPAVKARLYQSLGVSLTYHPETATTVEAAPGCSERVGGGT
jgi:hypothetical protein